MQYDKNEVLDQVLLSGLVCVTYADEIIYYLVAFKVRFKN